MLRVCFIVGNFVRAIAIATNIFVAGFIKKEGRKNLYVQYFQSSRVAFLFTQFLRVNSEKQVFEIYIFLLFSGIITQKDAINDTIKTITPKSGAAYFYFYSELNVNDAGYNISYRYKTCLRKTPQNFRTVGTISY